MGARHSLFAFSALLTLTFLASCGTREDDTLGVSFIEDQAGLKAVRDTLVDPPDSSLNFQLETPAALLETATTLVLGNRADLGLEACALLRFPADALPDTGTILDSGELELGFIDGWETGEPAFEFAIHRVLVPWTEASQAGVDTLPLFDSTAVDTVALGEPTVGDTLSFEMKDLMQRWIDLPDSNFGIVLLPTDASTGPIEFGSDEGSATLEPRLDARWLTTPTDTSQAFVVPSDDLTVLDVSAHVPLVPSPGRLTVARGVPARAFVRFPVPEFADRTTINRAEMRFEFDAAASEHGVFTLSVFRAVEEWNVAAPESTLAGAVARSGTADAGVDTVVVDVTDLVQDMLVDTNHGFLLRAADERVDFDFVRIHIDPASPALLPSLRIWYTPGDELGGSP